MWWNNCDSTHHLGCDHEFYNVPMMGTSTGMIENLNLQEWMSTEFWEGNISIDGRSTGETMMKNSFFWARNGIMQPGQKPYNVQVCIWNGSVGEEGGGGHVGPETVMERTKKIWISNSKHGYDFFGVAFWTKWQSFCAFVSPLGHTETLDLPGSLHSPMDPTWVGSAAY